MYKIKTSITRFFKSWPRERTHSCNRPSGLKTWPKPFGESILVTTWRSWKMYLYKHIMYMYICHLVPWFPLIWIHIYYIYTQMFLFVCYKVIFYGFDPMGFIPYFFHHHLVGICMSFFSNDQRSNFQECRYPPRSLRARPWKMMVGRWSFPFGMAYFRGNVKLPGSNYTQTIVKVDGDRHSQKVAISFRGHDKPR